MLGGAAVAALAVGCGNPSAAPPAASAPPPAAVPTPSSSAVRTAALPISAYQLSGQQRSAEHYVAQRLLQTCMARYGFSYLPGLSSKSIADNARVLQVFDSRRYGVSSAAAARAYGYNLPPWVTGSGPTDLKAQMSPAELLALAGPAARPGSRPVAATRLVIRDTPIPAGGCEGQAGRDLLAAGILQSLPGGGLAADIEGQAYARAQSDRRVLNVYHAWSACMRQYGYRYATPLKAATDPRWNLSAPPTRAEIQTARADVACKLRTNLLGITFAVESDYENAAIAQNAAALAELKYQVRAQGNDLARLLARYGG